MNATATLARNTTTLVPSATDPGTEYPVRLVDGQAVGCPCKGRTYRPRAHCSHMRQAEALAATATRTDRLTATRDALDAAAATTTGMTARDYRKARHLLDRPTITPAELATRDRYWDPLSYIDED